MPTSLVDYIKRGTHDDGGEGVVRTKLAQGDLVKVPFSSSVTTRAIGGSSSVALQTNALGTNADRGGSGFTLTAAAGIGNLCYIRQTLYGRVIGVRWRRDASTQNYPFSLIVDGVAYPVKNVTNRVDNSTSRPDIPPDYEALFVVKDDLISDGPHSVELQLMGDPYGGTTRKIIAFGWLVESGKGYHTPSALGVIPTTPVTLPTTATVISPAGPVRKLCFTTTDTVAHTVTVYTTSGQAYRTVSVPAAASGGYAEIDFGQPVNLANWRWMVDSGAVTFGWAQLGDAR